MNNFFKKSLCIIISFTILICTATYVIKAQNDYIFGDVNLDSRLTIMDATEIQKFLTEIVSFSPKQKQLADFNEDSKINITDATEIQKSLADIKKNSSLYNKTIYCDGDSVAYGAGSDGYSYCDFIADNNNMSMTKKAVSGTTLAIRNGRSDSILERVLAMTGDYDYILLEGGFNDMFLSDDDDESKIVQMGEITDGYTDDFDTSTAIGALEKICYFLNTQYPDSKKLFVLGHRIILRSCDKKQPVYWEAYRQVLQKWDIPYVDLMEKTDLCASNDELADKYFMISEATGHGDGAHPLRDTYEEFYVPIIEEKLNSL